jgi:hypothetical protein
MQSLSDGAISSWEDEGGASAQLGMQAGSSSQVEWAERIKRQVIADFDRVAGALRSVAGKQGEDRRDDIEAVIAILEEKRADVLSIRQAGFFIQDWWEINDQVRQMIGQDPRYQAIQAKRRIGAAVILGS